MVEQIPETQAGLRNGSSCDVVVVGAGLAGKAASIELAKAGLKVTCISPAEATRSAVGESLDWSAPELLKSLGLPMDHLIETQMATWKRHVTMRRFRLSPGGWDQRSHFDSLAVHVREFSGAVARTSDRLGRGLQQSRWSYGARFGTPGPRARICVGRWSHCHSNRRVTAAGRDFWP
jgi:glycine/D-amino acid oxidase-like deaminating enzyme